MMGVGAFPADAAQYTVRACGPGAGHQNRMLSASTSDGRMSAYTACPTDGNGHRVGIAALANIDAGTVPFFASAMQTFIAPGGTTIRSARVRAEGRTWNGDWTSLLQASNDRFASSSWNLSGCAGNPGSVNGCVSAVDSAERRYDIAGATGIRSVVGCASFSGCTTFSTSGWPFTRAYYFIHELDVTLDDLSAPSMRWNGGGLLNSGWIHGVQSASFDASDNSGIRRTEAAVEGLGVIGSNERACDFTFAVPCSNVAGGSYSLDTNRLEDGTHRIVVDAFDATGDNKADIDQTFRVDNHAPGEPEVPSVVGGEGWHTENGFTVNYRIPAGQAAPITRAYYELCKADGSACSTGNQDGTGINRLTNIRVPQPGDYTLRTWLMDAAGNVSGAKSAPVHLRFDNVPPDEAVPVRRNGWVNAVEAKRFVQGIDPPDKQPASKIAGYAVTTDGSVPSTSIDVPAEPASDFRGALVLRDLPEGTTRVRARAVSGAGLPSPQVGSTDLRVDLTPPTLTTVAPDVRGWIPSPVDLRISATDPGTSSGMAGAPADQPITAGAYIRHKVDDADPVVTRGQDTSGAHLPAITTSAVVSDDGQHTVQYQAFDLAGNPTTERSISFKIDQTPPELIVFEAQQEADPRLITVAASDRTSGLADGGRIQLRRISPSEGDWITLRTTRDGDRYHAHVDNTQLPEGDYQFRASIPDQAGNRGTGELNRQGQPQVIHISPTHVGPYRTADDSSVQNSGPDAPDAGATVDTKLTAGVVTRKVVHRKKCKKVRVGPGRKRKKCRKVPVRGPERLVHEARIPFGKAAATRGVLTQSDGTPIANAEVVVLSRQATEGASYIAAASVRTDGQGRFGYTLPAGPSRSLAFAYRGNTTLRHSDDELSLMVPASATIKASRRAVRNGGVVNFSGKLRGRPYPSRGKVVDLQAFYRGKWRTFATPRATRRGSWKHRYRFEATRGTVIYPFRIRVRASSDYPYETGYSKSIKVRVRG
jgi:hypothetical protein